MLWSDDVEASLSKKMQPKLGRRAAQSNRQSSDEFNSADDILENTNEEIQMPVRARKAGGWADETLKSGKNKSSTNLIEQERFQEQKINVEDDDIPVIPDIDEIPDDVLTSDVAEAPSVAVNRVSTYKELDKDLLKQNAFSQFGDINLSHLTRFLYSEKEIRDPDIVWTKESLFNELISEYRGSLNETK